MTKNTLLAFTLLATFAAIPAQAAIVITGASTIVETSAATDATATFELTVRGFSTTGDSVGFFGFDIALPSVPTLAITSREFVTPVGPGWSFFDSPGTAKLEKTDVDSVTTRFAGGPDGVIVSAPPFGTPFPTTPSDLAIIKFSVDRGLSDATYSMTFAEADAIFFPAGVIPAGGENGKGFFRDADFAVAGSLVEKLSTDFGAKDFTVAGLTAVPEPSSALLCGMGLLGLVGYRRRRAA